MLAAIIINPKLGIAQIAAGIITFFHLAAWTVQHLTPGTLNSALAIFFIFGVIHSVFPVVWQRLKPGNTYALQGAFSPWFPPLALLLMLLPVLCLLQTSYSIWPAILLVDVLAIVVAVSTAMLLPVLAVLVITMGIALAWLLKVQVQIESELPFLLIVGIFAAFFAVAGCWLAKRHSAVLRRTGEPSSTNDKVAAALPVLSAALPFLLLIMATQQLHMVSPTPVFTLGLALVLLLLGLARISGFSQLCLAALGCMFALEFFWHVRHFNGSGVPAMEFFWRSGHHVDSESDPGTALLWYLGIYVMFAAYPFVFRNAFRQTVAPWATAARAAVAQFALVYITVKASYPSMADKLGLVPATFAAPSLLSLFALARYVKSKGEARTGQLAWFGGVALLFITLIFPIQFHRQWITLGWAIEGAALIWLFRRVPHEGLRLTGLALLGAAFVRLAMNPAVLSYQPHSETFIFNWYFYAYGIAAAAMFLGAWWLREPHHQIGDVDARAVLWALGGILLFCLLNIEIADGFTPQGARFTTIDLSGINLGRDMTYSIAWGLFALALLITGFAVKARGARYAGIGLMAVTLLKVFLHDLAELESIYRIVALIGVALIALAASFLYQRFFERTKA